MVILSKSLVVNKSDSKPGNAAALPLSFVCKGEMSELLSDAEVVLFTQVCTEGRLILEFAFDDLMRIKTWHFNIRQYRELIPRSILAMHVSVTSLTHDLYLKKKIK